MGHSATHTGNKRKTLGALRRLGPWFHNLHLPDGRQTAPEHFLGDFPRRKWKLIAPFLKAELSGKKVLDIGCNAGFYSIELAKRGATVTAIDKDVHYLKQAEWALKVFGLESSVTLQQRQVYDLARDRELYDIVWFMGVFYHLRYPLLGLDIAASKTAGQMVFQSMLLPGNAQVRKPQQVRDLGDRRLMLRPGWPKMAFIEHELVGDRTNWWVANHAGIRAMLRSSGLTPRHYIGEEIYLCQRSKASACWEDWNQDEFRAAAGL